MVEYICHWVIGTKFLEMFVRYSIQRALACTFRQISTSTEPAVDFVKIDRREDVTIITLNRPHCKNAVNDTMANQLSIAMGAFEEDETSGVAILHGSGDSFCSGYDLMEVSEYRGLENDEAKKDKITNWKENGPMGITRKLFKKPVIAALHGYVVGGGMEMALACDLRIATPDVTIGGFNRKWGVPFIDGCSARLPALVGLSRALDLMLTGRAVDAKEALAIGLVNRVVDDDLISEAFNIAKRISSSPQVCMLTDRQNIYYSVYNAKSFQEALDNELENGLKVIDVDSIKGAKKFLKHNRRK